MLSTTEILISMATGAVVSQADILNFLHSAATCSRAELLRAESHARIKLRDALLLEVAGLLSADEPTLWKLAERLEAAVNRFQTRVWPRLKAGLNVGILSPVDSVLHKAFLTGEYIPATQRHIYELLKK